MFNTDVSENIVHSGNVCKRLVKARTHTPVSVSFLPIQTDKCLNFFHVFKFIIRGETPIETFECSEISQSMKKRINIFDRKTQNAIDPTFRLHIL